MRARWSRPILVLLGTMLWLFASGDRALAADGVVLIDQKRAEKGGITPGDGPGFPVVIAEPGHYRLSSNLTVPGGALPNARNAFHIAASDVTLDLNGFSIISAANPLAAIVTVGGSYSRIAIRNGNIRVFDTGVLLEATAVVVENLRITTAPSGGAGSGITVGTGPGSVAGASNAIIRGNVTDGLIGGTCPAIVTDNIASSVGFQPTHFGSCDPDELVLRDNVLWK